MSGRSTTGKIVLLVRAGRADQPKYGDHGVGSVVPGSGFERARVVRRIRPGRPAGSRGRPRWLK
jgi:hypothetical protein